MIDLVRTHVTEDGTFGKLRYSGNLWVTCEDDWKDNQPNESCIPHGSYVCKRTIYHKHGYETFEVTEVPGRNRILFHPGNTEEDTQGCILIGKRFGKLLVHDEDDPNHPAVMKEAVVGSKLAFEEFMYATEHLDTFTLNVYWFPSDS